MESATVKDIIQSTEDVADRLIAKIRPHARTLAKVKLCIVVRRVHHSWGRVPIRCEKALFYCF